MKGLHTKAASNDIQTASFSFDIIGSPQQLTPNIVVGNTQGTTRRKDNGEKAENDQLQSQIIPHHKLQQPDSEVRIEKKGKNKDETTKQATEQAQGK